MRGDAVMTIRSTVIREALEAEAERAVPSETNLWPAISAAAVARPMNEKSPLARGPIRLHGIATRRLGVALSLAVVILVAGMLLPSREQGAAAAVLNDLAAVAAVQSAPLPVGASGYRYTKTERMSLNLHFDASQGDPLAALVSKTSSEWIAADGSGRLRETTGEPIYLNERSRSSWDAASLRAVLVPFNLDFGPRQLIFDDLSGLPTDPAVLAGVIRERAQRTPGGDFGRGLDRPSQVFWQGWVPPYGWIETHLSLPHAMFFTIGNMLSQQSAPPAVRAALYKVAAGIPGVELLGPVHDRAGRPGVAVAITSAYTGLRLRHVLILDEGTSALLAQETVLLEAAKWMDAKPPLVVGYTTYLEAAIVERLPIE
jgi:hypothetical protein